MSFASFIPRYLLALVVTVSAYGIYGKFITPMIEGQTVFENQGPIVPIQQRSDRDIKAELAGLFPEEGWEWQPCTILETEQAMVLFHDHTVLEDGSIELKPLSLVMNPPPRNVDGQIVQPPPIVLRSPDGATLKFENGFSADGNMGKLEHGHLAGNVQLFRPESAPGADDALTMETQNVQISPERISTIFDCNFRFGQSYGRGKHLTVDLVGPGTQTKSTATFTDVHRVRLARVYEMFLHRKEKQPSALLPPDGLGSPTSTIALNSNNQASTEGDLLGDTSRSLMLQSRGPMVVDFLGKTASFENDVLVRSADSAGDQLQCELLTIYFQDKASNDEGLLGSSENKSDFEIQRLLAEGNSDKPVVLTATSRQAQATAERMDYDLIKKQVTLSSVNRDVTLAREQQFMQARQIQYSFVPDGRLGNAVLQGPGLLRQTDRDAPDKEMLVRWENKLTIQDDIEAPGKKIVSLDGAKLSMNGTRVNSTQMHIWFWEVAEATADGSNKWRFEPSKLLAEGDVSFDSEKLEGNCREAAVFWPQPIQGSGRPAAGSSSFGRVKQQPRNQLAHPAHRYVVARAAYPVVTQQQANPPETSKTRFVGVQVQLQMQGGPDKGAVDKMRVDGNVAVQQMQTTNGIEETKLDIRGQALEVITRGKDLYRLIVLGAETDPAVVTSRELLLQGNKITLDQPANRLWVDGPGRLQLKNQARQNQMTENQPATRNASAVTGSGKSATTDVNWLGGMVFDGQQIYFETAVRSDSLQQNPGSALASPANSGSKSTTTQTESAALSITLNRRIDFSNREKIDQPEDDLEATELVMVGWLQKSECAFAAFYRDTKDRRVHVATGNYDAAGQLLSNQEIFAPRATFNVQSGQARCKGPGSVIARQRGSGGLPGATAARQAVPQDRAAGQDKITFVKVNYENDFSGNMNDRELNFSGNVHTFYSESARWDDVPDERLIRQPNHPGVIMDCENLMLAQWTPQGSKPVVEMVATGNSRVKGSQFDATAERISYTESNGQVTIEAPNRGNAELWVAAPGRTKRGKLVGKTITYNIVTGEAQVQQMKRMNFSQQGR